MTKDFITLEQEAAVRELGYDEPCVAIFKNPLKSQVFRWFRDEYGYYVDFIIFNKEDYASPISKRDDIEISFVIYRAFDNLYSNYDELFTTGYSLGDEGGTVWDNYEEAEDDCINTLIELVKQKSNV